MHNSTEEPVDDLAQIFTFPVTLRKFGEGVRSVYIANIEGFDATASSFAPGEAMFLLISSIAENGDSNGKTFLDAVGEGE